MNIHEIRAITKITKPIVAKTPPAAKAAQPKAATPRPPRPTLSACGADATPDMRLLNWNQKLIAEKNAQAPLYARIAAHLARGVNLLRLQNPKSCLIVGLETCLDKDSFLHLPSLPEYGSVNAHGAVTEWNKKLSGLKAEVAATLPGMIDLFSDGAELAKLVTGTVDADLRLAAITAKVQLETYNKKK